MDTDDRPTTAKDLKRCLGGRFVLLDDVPDGSGAVVVRAQDQRFPRLVAIKLLRSNNADTRRRFLQEGELLAAIDHPGIVDVLDRGADGDDLYMALELIDGPDLWDFQDARSRPMPWRDAVEVGVQIASALHAVHRKGLVHRDVKPANIMLAESGERMRVKLIDFGIAGITENYRAPQGSTPRRPTTVGTALGTPGYLPLEAGLVPANPLFDVYGLGATLYELLTGELPEEPLQPLRDVCPDCDAPEDLEIVLTAALALEPQDRTQSAAELGRALEAVRAAHPDLGEPSERIEGRYELIGLAGTGGKADVYVATHRGTGHDVVLKFLRSSDPEEGLRFTREAKLLQTFNHPALPRFYDYSPGARPPYIAMAHAPGRPAARLCSPPRLRPLEVAAVGLKLAQVLAVMHGRGVLHRDINANNVLIDATGAVTLIDLGCAELTQKFYDVPAGEQRYLTPPEARVAISDGGIGQFQWSAPEVRAGRPSTDKSDVYSMGHLLFRLLTGKLPVRNADPPTSPQRYASTCPDDLAEAVSKTLNVDPSQRPSAAEFAATLKDVLETEEELRERILAQTAQLDRPPLRLVPTPRGMKDWTQHPVPDASSEDDVPSLAKVEPLNLAPATATPSGRRPRLWQAAFIGVVSLAAAWGFSMLGRPKDPDASLASLSAPAPEQRLQESPASSSPSLPSQSLPASSPPPLLTSEAALDGKATEALRLCSKLAGGLLFVEFKILQQGIRFDSATVSGSTTPDLDRCVSNAVAGVRFQAQGADTFTKEYTP